MSRTLWFTGALLLSQSTFASNYQSDWYTKGEVELGPRPHFLVSDMDDSELKEKLRVCEHQPSRRSTFSIGHRGAALQFPEHTKESYEAAARMGAGIIECDVTFTKDKELVCRHSQCDLHTTTNILATPLAEKCSVPFTPADPVTGTPAQAMCCTSDLTLEEFKSLKGKMDASNPQATTVEEYMNATADYRTDLYATRGTLMTHKESIELFKSLGAKMTPELKTPSVDMPYNGDYSQSQYAQQMIDEYRQAGVKASDVFPQSFLYDDILYWIEQEPEFGKQAVFLDGRYDLESFDVNDAATWQPSMETLVADGVKYLAPPMWMLLASDDGETLKPSFYADSAKAAGLNLITWTLERSGPLATGGGWYYQGVNDLVNNDGDMLYALDVMAQQVGIKGIFSDWPATVTYYANCMGLE
jgi:glycerophosphoryl diester phosphodiesterase